MSDHYLQVLQEQVRLKQKNISINVGLFSVVLAVIHIGYANIIPESLDNRSHVRWSRHLKKMSPGCQAGYKQANRHPEGNHSRTAALSHQTEPVKVVLAP